MRRAAVNGIELEYETFGDESSPGLLLIAGLGSQMITWDDDLCGLLVDRGFFVVRFDNRDVGLSTQIDDDTPYTLADMADDAAGLLDHLGLDAVHVVGASMGGMIAQELVLRYPQRALTLTSIYSRTGAPDIGLPLPDVAGRIIRPRAKSIEEAIEGAYATCVAIWGDSPELPFDEERARRRAEMATRRAYTPEGTVRQALAIQRSPDRTERLRSVRIPTLVVHGDNDPLVTVAGGIHTAETIPGAELMIIKGMGHVLDRRVWPDVVDAIEKLAARAAV
jgi:pimeloyl-ACP methyl ester carboxylesterase